jgi:hypothetical protein
MKILLFLCIFGLLSPAAFAQTSEPQLQTGATAGNAQSAPIPPVVIEKPTPEGQVLPRIITPPETSADVAIRKQADTAISDRAEEVSDECDAHFGARIDWTTISPQELRMSNPENNCGAVLDALEQICATSEGRAHIGPTVKGVVCTAGVPPALSIHAGTLVYTLDWQSTNPAAYAYAWLAAHL